MKIDFAAVRKCLKAFDFNTLFREHLGWDNHQAQLDIPIDGSTIQLHAVAQKRGFVAFVCQSIPDRPTRLKLDHQVAKSAREHFIVYADKGSGQQVWQWVRREPGKPMASRDHRFDVSQSGDPLIQRLNQIAVSLDEEETLTVVDVAGRARAAFDVDRVTKRFYKSFKDEHAAFQGLIQGIKSDADLQWYTSVMLNRMMFVYFIQKKGFLDGDTDYLRNRLKRVQQLKGKDKFLSFYRYFLLRLFHEGLGKSPDERRLDPEMERLLGEVPFLNGGFFEVHQIEEQNPDIDITDEAFEKLFDFFDEYSWHLDERPLRADNEINPDVVGYIYEKYINQKQMGAYYTKEDITEYISKNTIIPFLFDAAHKKCAVAFRPESALWRLLRDDPDRYIYPAVRHGVVRPDGTLVAESELPDFVQKGMHEPKARMHDKRYNLQQASGDDPIRLVTETWREYIYRRTRCLEVREKLRKGEVHEINDLVTLNLDIWQFARDASVNAEGPELLRAFWHTLVGRIPEKSNEKFEQGITVLDPTCGSGAFLFAALRILETLYSDCLERMERFIEDIADKPHHPEQYSDFKKVLAQIAKHPNDRYFILKSIVINNLFGVDIMAEAVEICKLRLFLKLVAQVENVGQIEPLPDIDFNIRTGNTLVGYATADDVRKAFTEERAGKLVQKKLLLGDTSEDYRRFDEDAELVERAFCQFRAQQTAHGGKVRPKDKQKLRGRLAKLDAELDRYLASEYAINVEKQNDFDTWKASHQPFHWFVEFYGITHAGGFDVIIGNPPYVEYKDVKDVYQVRGYATLNCKDLYAFTAERAYALVRREGRVGLIVPISIFGVDGFSQLQHESRERLSDIWVSSFANRPAQLFDGAQKRLTIMVGRRGDSTDPELRTTAYLRWKREEFPALFATRVRYAPLHPAFTVFPASLEKLGNSIETHVFAKLTSVSSRLEAALAADTRHRVYYTRKFGYFLAFLDFIPRVVEIRSGRKVSPSELKDLCLASQETVLAVMAALSSSTFFWFWNVLSDCRNLNRRDILAFPLDPNLLSARDRALLAELGTEYRETLKRSSHEMQKSGLMLQTFEYATAKPILDEIDRVLANHYGFTDEELDFIINYDIKYRMGQDNDDGDED